VALIELNGVARPALATSHPSLQHQRRIPVFMLQ